MSGRPEHVKCENCVFWTGPFDDIPEHPGRYGWCHQRGPTLFQHTRTEEEDEQAIVFPFPPIAEDDFCGEFRETWPVLVAEEEAQKP